MGWQRNLSIGNFTGAFKKSKWLLSDNAGLCRGFSASAKPELPGFDYQPKPYKGPFADEVLQKRKKYLGPSLFYYYQKPVSLFSLLVYWDGSNI